MLSALSALKKGTRILFPASTGQGISGKFSAVSGLRKVRLYERGKERGDMRAGNIGRRGCPYIPQNVTKLEN